MYRFSFSDSEYDDLTGASLEDALADWKEELEQTDHLDRQERLRQDIRAAEERLA